MTIIFMAGTSLGQKRGDQGGETRITDTRGRRRSSTVAEGQGRKVLRQALRRGNDGKRVGHRSHNEGARTDGRTDLVRRSSPRAAGARTWISFLGHVHHPRRRALAILKMVHISIDRCSGLWKNASEILFPLLKYTLAMNFQRVQPLIPFQCPFPGP